MKIDPIRSPKPTNADLAHQGTQLHACLEEAHLKIDNVTIVVDEIKAGLGLAPDGKRTSGLSSPFSAFIRTVGATATSIGAFVLFYKIVIVLTPAVVQLLSAIDHAIRTGAF